MAFIPVPNVSQVTLKMSYFSQTIVNTLYFLKSGGFSGTDLADLANAAAQWWGDNMVSALSTDITLFAAEARDISTESGPVSEFFPVTPIPGTVASPGLPGNVAWTIQFKTGFAGRSFRGRNYISGIAETGASGNQIALSIAADIVAAYVVLNSDLNTVLAVQHVVVSRFTGGAPRTTGIATAVETYGYFDLFLDSQRRRLTGRGT